MLNYKDLNAERVDLEAKIDHQRKQNRDIRNRIKEDQLNAIKLREQQISQVHDAVNTLADYVKRINLEIQRRRMLSSR